jgi:hypothetical protein
MPDPAEIAARLGVYGLPGDPLTVEDLSSAKGTRMGMQRELIKRRPDIYTRRWLAARHGVCIQTIDTYNRTIPLNFRHLFIEQPISWATLYAVPVDEPPPDMFLRDGKGKHYKAELNIAASLLKKGQTVKLMRQDGNYYWYGDNLPDICVKFGIHPHHEEYEAEFKRRAAAAKAKRREADKIKADAFDAKLKAALEKINVAAAAATATYAEARKNSSEKMTSAGEGLKPSPTETLSALEQPVLPAFVAADPYWLYENMSNMSLKTAHDLVKIYSRSEIQFALRVLQSRNNITNPTGFLIMFLRSNHKFPAFKP